MNIELDRERGSAPARLTPRISRPDQEPALEEPTPQGRDRGGRFRRLGRAVPAVIVAGILATTLTGCSESDYAEICLDPATAVQVEDARCESRETNATGSAFLWYYLARGNVVPGVGQPLPGGTSALRNPTLGTSVKPSVGSVSRGGFSSGFGGSFKGGGFGG